MKRLFVAGLAYSVTDSQLQELFADYGTVVSAKIILNRDTGQSKGFGFVEFSTEEEAQSAIKALHDTDFLNRKLVVKDAKPREDNNSGGRVY